MTRKDYVLIAEVLKGSRDSFEDSDNTYGYLAHATHCEVFASALASTNPLFNKVRFLEACGV